MRLATSLGLIALALVLAAPSWGAGIGLHGEERATLRALSHARLAHHLPPVKRSPALTKAARRRARWVLVHLHRCRRGCPEPAAFTTSIKGYSPRHWSVSVATAWTTGTHHALRRLVRRVAHTYWRPALAHRPGRRAGVGIACAKHHHHHACALVLVVAAHA